MILLIKAATLPGKDTIEKVELYGFSSLPSTCGQAELLRTKIGVVCDLSYKTDTFLISEYLRFLEVPWGHLVNLGGLGGPRGSLVNLGGP